MKKQTRFALLFASFALLLGGCSSGNKGSKCGGETCRVGDKNTALPANAEAVEETPLLSWNK